MKKKMALPEGSRQQFAFQHCLPHVPDVTARPHFPCAKGDISAKNRERLTSMGFQSLGIDPEAETFQSLSPIGRARRIREASSQISKGHRESPSVEGLRLHPREAEEILRTQLQLPDPNDPRSPNRLT